MPGTGCLTQPPTLATMRRDAGVVGAIVVATLIGAAACTPTTTARETSAGSGSAGSGATVVTAVEEDATTTAASDHPTSTDGATSSETPSAGAVDLAALVIDDRPTPDRPYVRDEWPHWADVDGDGCDGRQQALREHSRTPAQIDAFGGCTVVAGDWVSTYDGVETSNPGDLDIDHVVPLENAHNSGGWRFGAEQRRAFANDPGNLLPVTASSNRSKGSKLPNEWRPPQQSSWCELATRWVTTKVRWQLSATTEERDALGQMLDTCVGPG